jgi:hypothetical protein
MADQRPPVAWDEVSAALPNAGTLAAVESVDRHVLSPSQLLDTLLCCERLLSHVAGLQMALLAEFTRPGRSGDISRIVQATAEAGGLAHRSDGRVDTDILAAVVTDHAHGMAAAELAASLDIAPITARRRVEAAVDLQEGLPRTLEALTDGVIDRGRASLIAECTSTLEPDLRRDVEDRILPMIGGRTAGRLRPLIERAVLIADPDTTKKRIEKARGRREVTHLPLKDQLSQIKAVLPAEGAVSVFTLIDLLAGATKAANDDRSVAERRADALTDLATELLTHEHLDLRGLLEPGTAASEDDGFGDDPDTDLAGGNSWYDQEGMPIDEPDPLAGRTESVPHSNGSRIEVADGHDGGHRTPEDSADNSGREEHTPIVSSQLSAPQAMSDGDRLNGPTDRSVDGPQSARANEKPTQPKVLPRQGRRPHLTVTMSLSTLMALDDLPAHLEGYGAITAELATAIAAAATSVSIAVVDPHTGAAQHASARFGLSTQSEAARRCHDTGRDVSIPIMQTACVALRSGPSNRL